MNENNNFFTKLLGNIVNTIKTKTYGCFVGLLSLILSIAVCIVYKSAYNGTEYYSSDATLIIALGLVLFIVLSLFSYTSKYAAIPMFLANFTAFLLFGNSVYIYFSEVFYGGINAEAFAALDKKMVTCIILFVLAFITANVAMYLKQNKSGTIFTVETTATTEEDVKNA